MALRAAKGVSNDEYLVEMERFRSNHPTDPAVELVSIDYYLLKEDFQAMFKSIDQLDKEIGGDPYLNILRAGGLMEAGQFMEASAAAEMAVKAVAKLPQGYWMRATFAAKQRNNADVLAWFKKLIDTTGTEVMPADLETDERFAGFVKSPEFRDLKAWLAKRPK